MLHFDQIVFGPIHSRRLGASLGVNILPVEGKLCNFDCIYCECGWNRDGASGKKIFPTVHDVRKALEVKLKQCQQEHLRIDSITFSGNGEPTLNPDFPAITDVTLELRDRFFPHAKVSVLSNATTLDRKGVLEALKRVDNPIMKIDAGDDDGVRLVNRPSSGYSLEETVSLLEQFGGNFILQTMFLGGPDFITSSPGNLGRWMDIVRRLHPREIMVYTIDRETPMKGLRKFSAEQMEALTRPLADEGFHIQIRG